MTTAALRAAAVKTCLIPQIMIIAHKRFSALNEAK